jgi:hypothetical protein
MRSPRVGVGVHRESPRDSTPAPILAARFHFRVDSRRTRARAISARDVAPEYDPASMKWFDRAIIVGWYDGTTVGITLDEALEPWCFWLVAELAGGGDDGLTPQVFLRIRTDCPPNAAPLA